MSSHEDAIWTELHYDLIVHIASVSPVYTTLKLMLTCRDLNRDCLKYLFRDQIRLSSNRKITSFLRFMNESSTVPRWQHLSSLDLHFDPFNISNEMFERLVTALSQAIYLRELRLSGDHGEMHEICPEIMVVFTSLPRVQVFEAHPKTSDDFVWKLLETTRWPLTTVRICTDVADDEWSDMDNQIPHPIILLKNVRRTLQCLSITSLETCSYRIPHYSFVYPHMRSLELGFVGWIPIIRWIRAFPNLTYMKINTSDMTFSEDDLGQLYVHRQMNIRAQEEEGTWRQLTEVDAGGCLEYIYLLGILCPIRSLDISITVDPMLSLVYPVLEYAKPLKLRLAAPHLSFTDLINLLRLPCLTGLEELKLVQTGCNPDTTTDPDSFLRMHYVSGSSNVPHPLPRFNQVSHRIPSATRYLRSRHSPN